ncbi:MAG: hypothetical protein WC477_05385 [Patescibacteria group bacterium]
MNQSASKNSPTSVVQLKSLLLSRWNVLRTQQQSLEARIQTYLTGKRIERESSAKPLTAYLVISGSVTEKLSEDSGTDIIIRHVQRGEIFCAHALIEELADQPWPFFYVVERVAKILPLTSGIVELLEMDLTALHLFLLNDYQRSIQMAELVRQAIQNEKISLFERDKAIENERIALFERDATNDERTMYYERSQQLETENTRLRASVGYVEFLALPAVAEAIQVLEKAPAHAHAPDDGLVDTSSWMNELAQESDATNTSTPSTKGDADGPEIEISNRPSETPDSELDADQTRIFQSQPIELCDDDAVTIPPPASEPLQDAEAREPTPAYGTQSVSSQAPLPHFGQPKPVTRVGTTLKPQTHHEPDPDDGLVNLSVPPPAPDSSDAEVYAEQSDAVAAESSNEDEVPASTQDFLHSKRERTKHGTFLGMHKDEIWGPNGPPTEGRPNQVRVTQLSTVFPETTPKKT